MNGAPRKLEQVRHGRIVAMHASIDLDDLPGNESRFIGGQEQRRIANIFGLAMTGLGVWIAYLATGVTAVAWIASPLLLPVTGLGLAVLIASLPEQSLAATASVPVAEDPPPARHPPAMVVAAHGVFAVATILFAILAALRR